MSDADDLHELRSEEALRQLELLLMRSPPELRFVLLTRQDVRLGLHRLRLEGGLSELRAPDLRFSRQEARALFEFSGVQLSDSALGQLHERTEGWVAGLRLAALSLAGHPDPERFAREFSGSERAVSEYLLVEVLERQPEDVQRLLLRTSVLERVNGRTSGRGRAPRASRTGLDSRHSPALRPLVRPLSRWAGGHRTRSPDEISTPSPRGESGARRDGGRR